MHLFFNKNLPVTRGIYAGEKGQFGGEFLIFIKNTSKDMYSFLCLPKMTKHELSLDQFNTLYKNKEIVLLEKLPVGIFKACLDQYNFIVDKRNK